MIPRLVELLRKEPFKYVVLKLLYHVSSDDRCKSTFSYTDAITIVSCGDGRERLTSRS